LEHNRKRVAKRLASGLMAGALALGGLAISGSSPAGAVPIEIGEDLRIAGDDRYATSALVAETLEDELNADLETVIVASGENYPDALAASALAGTSSAILLTESDSLPSSVRDRMFRLADSVEDVYIVGGEAAVSADVEDEISEIFDDADVTRLSGDDRYATAAAIADEVGLDAGTVAIVSGTNFADAVSIGPWAATQGFPILLANSDGLPDATLEALEAALDEETEQVVIVGGTSAVAAGVEDALVELGFPPSGVVRVAGEDRYATNLAWQLENLASILEAGPNKFLTDAQGLELGGAVAMLVSGTNFPDALSAAPLAALEGAHLVITSSTGGSAALTLAAISGGAGAISYQTTTGDGTRSAVAGVPDSELGSATASFIDGATGATPAATYSLSTLWVVGGENAVPDSVISTMDAAADASLGCSIIVAGANEESSGAQEGPRSFIIAFDGNLSNAPVGAGGGVAEYEYLDTEANLEELVEINGTDGVEQADQIGLDLDSDGFQDAIMVTYAAAQELNEGDSIAFIGIEEDTEDYTGTNGVGLRELSACEAEIDDDDTAPEITVSASVGGDDIYVEFDEPLADGGSTDGTAWATVIAAALNAGDGGANVVTCININGLNQEFACTGDGSGPGVAATDDLNTDTDGDDTDAAWTFFDNAGNEVGADAADNFATADADGVGGSIDDASVVCKRVNENTRIGEIWEDSTGGDIATDLAGGFVNGSNGKMTFDGGQIDLLLDGSSVELQAQSGITGLDANDWTVTVTHERGLLRPTVEVDGTDMTVTVDKYVHNGADIETAINISAWGKGGLSPIWLAVSNDDDALVDTEALDEAQDSAMAAAPGEASLECLITLTLDTVSAADPVNDTTLDDVGDIHVRVGGDSQTVTWNFAGVSSGTSQAATSGYVMYGLFSTSDEGTVRIDMITGFMDDGDSDVTDYVTVSIS